MQEFTGGKLAPGPFLCYLPKLMPNGLLTHLLLDLLLLAQLILPSLPVLLIPTSSLLGWHGSYRAFISSGKSSCGGTTTGQYRGGLDRPANPHVYTEAGRQ